MVIFITMEILSGDAYASDIAVNSDVILPQGDLTEVENSLGDIQEHLDYISTDIGNTFNQGNSNYDATEQHISDVEGKIDKITSDLEGVTNTVNDTSDKLTKIENGVDSITKNTADDSGSSVDDEILAELRIIKNSIVYIQKQYVPDDNSALGSTGENGEQTREANNDEPPHTIDDIYNALEFGCQSIWLLLGFLSALIVGKVFLL